MPSPQLTSLIAEAFPGARIMRTQRLRGGISATMLAVTIERPDGSQQKVSVRRLRQHILEPGGISYEFEVLQLLERVGISAPRPLHVDAEGKHFGDPALVMTYLPGVSNVAPPDTAPWTDELAKALRQVHQINPATNDLSMLRPLDNHQRIDDIAAESQGNPLAAEVVEVLRRHCHRIEPLPPTLVHNDYWSGNTIWNRGRLTGIIDWTHARLGDPRHDISECRGALVFDHDEATADQLLAAYERHAGHAIPHIWFFDLIRAVVAYVQHEDWIEGVQDFGVQLDAADVKARLAAFVRLAISQAEVEDRFRSS